MEYTKVCGIVRDKGACGFYRIEQPLTFLNEDNDFDVAIGGAGSGMDNDLFQLLQTCDVVILPRAASEESLHLVTVLHDMSPSKKVIIDHDDDIFNVNPSSPHYKDRGTKNAKVKANGRNVVIWKDGRNSFDIERNRNNLELAKEILGKADGVFVTTPKLADVYGEYNDNITVLPNSLDFNIWKPYKLEKDNNIRITWHGGYSHYEDLNEISSELKNITTKHKNVKLEICGYEFKGVFDGIDPDKYTQHDWVDVSVHPYKQILLNADIGVIPLADNKFNKSKSPIKWIEYSALGIPCVVKDIEPYSNLIIHGINGFLYTNTEEFEFWVDKLVEHPSLRERIGKAAQEYVHEHFDVRKNSKYWSEAIKNITEKKCLSLH